jgi:hypothetical protein
MSIFRQHITLSRQSADRGEASEVEIDLRDRSSGDGATRAAPTY